MTKMIPVSHAEAMIQDLATQARIEEYDCATKLHSGDIEGAKDMFRKSIEYDPSYKIAFELELLD